MGRLLPVAAILLVSSLDGQEPARSWNVLLIVVDDLNTALGCYGDPVAKTPHLDGLARRGLRFDRAYCQYPLCGPSRVSLLTGLRPDSTAVSGNRKNDFRAAVPDAETLPGLFRKSGYFTARIGKIFHKGVPEDVVAGGAGLDDPPSWDSALDPPGEEHKTRGQGRNLTPQFDAEKNGSSAFHWIASAGEGEDQADTRAASEAIRFLEKKRDKPFRETSRDVTVCSARP